MKDFHYCIITTTVSNKNEAKKITEALLAARLVACVQHIEIESHYRWEKCLHADKEILLQMKTHNRHFNDVKNIIEQLHSYEIPEIIMLPILDANTAYLGWIKKEVTKKKK